MKKTKIILPSFDSVTYLGQAVDFGRLSSLRANDSYAVSQASIASQQMIRDLALRFPLNTRKATLWYRFGLRNMSTIALVTGKRRVFGHCGNISSRKGSFTIIV